MQAMYVTVQADRVCTCKYLLLIDRWFCYRMHDSPMSRLLVVAAA